MNYKVLSWIVIFIIGALTLVSGFMASKLEFDYNFENFFPKHDEESSFYIDFRESFRSDNDFVIIGISDNNGIFNSRVLEHVDSLVHNLEGLNNVDAVYSPTTFEEPIFTGFGPPFFRPILNIHDNDRLQVDSTRLVTRPEYTGVFFSEDGKSLALQVMHKQYLDKVSCDTLGAQIQRLVKNYRFDESHAIGRSIGQDVYISMMQNEMLVFIAMSMILIVVFLFVAFRSLWGIVIPLTVVLLSICWNLGVMYLLGQKVDLMLTILPTIIFVVGMSDVVHIISRYFEELRTGSNKMTALRVTFKEIGLATFLTSLTTAVGFLTLMTSTIMPISKFGLYTAIGVFLAYILAFTLLPAILVLKKTPRIGSSNPRKIFWTKVMHSQFLWTLKNQKNILWISLGIAVLSLVGISKVEVNNFILEDLKEDHFLKQEFKFFADNFSGARPFELSITFLDSSAMFDLEVLREIQTIESYIYEDYGAGALISPVSVISAINRSTRGGSDKYYKLPDDQQSLDKIVRNCKKLGERNPLSFIVNQRDNLARIAGKCPDIGKIEYDKKNEAFYQFVGEQVNPQRFEVKLTGTGHLIDVNNEQLSHTLLQGLAIAFVIVALIVMLMFKSWKMVLITLIPNIIPLLMIAGIMGFFGIYLKASTAIIFTIAFGIAVDDTIHYLSKYRLLTNHQKNKLYALKRTSISTGKAIVVTSFILVAGFVSLVFSDFLGTFYIGLLISLTLLFAVLADLFLLPVLILKFYKPKQRDVK